LGNKVQLPLAEEIVYSDEQKRAIDEITSTFEKHEVTLLHGVTSSGKTEVYIHFMEQALAQGKQVLYLLPEIALTAQLVRRLQKHFGNKVGVYHSRFSSNERVELWNNVLNGKSDANHYQVILGARSALFLPYCNLGLVIVDEEHEQSFKQQTPSPRYQARDAAIILAKQHGAKTLLGSATPSVESYFNAMAGKFGLVSMPLRYGGIEMPEICVVDLKEASRKKRMHSHFSQQLLDSIQTALNAKEQVILFQNRRGFAPYLECPSCDWSPSCINCDVTLVYHKQSNRLRCHYCSFQQELPTECPACSDPAIKMMGFGTEKIEEELALFFPKAKIGRLDVDTARSRESFHNIIYDFEKRKTDILVGTQMVTKGLDFDHVSTVGIMNADSMLKHPDFRASERSFQLMAQVSGRSGRRSRRGVVLIQAFQAYHPVINQVMANDYLAFYNQEIIERERFNYPPFVRLVELSLRHDDARWLEDAANKLIEELRLNLPGQDILGPQAPVVSRVRGLFIQNILIKFRRDNNLTNYKSILEKTILYFKAREANRSLTIQVDVDPL
jgi:primosomal protein N' (replication factor Y)